MASFSISAAWEDMIGFMRRESGLLVPLSMATFGVAGMLASLAVPAPIQPGAAAAPSLNLLLLLPALLLLTVGNMAVTILALTPGSSVAEAMRRAAVRLPVIVGAAFLLACALLVAILIVAIAMTPLLGSSAATLGTAIGLLLGLAAGVPMLMLSPVVAMEPVSIIGAFRRVIQIVRGHISRLFAVLCVMIIVTLSVSLIATIVVTSVAKLLSMAMGQPMLISLIGDIILAAVSALLSMANATYVAFAYKRLAS
jgi:hypothetical protein